MSDPSEFTRLAELLIGRQDQQQQQLDLLTTNVIRIAEQAADYKQLITQNHERITQTELGLADHTSIIAQNQERIAQNERMIEVVVEVQQRIITQLELIYNEQQRFNQRQEEFNQRQEGFNQRQDDFNIIFLEELRELKGDVREIRRDIKDLRDVVLTQHEERLRRLEDFMNGFKNAA